MLKRVQELGGSNFVDGEADEDELNGGLGTQPDDEEATTTTEGETNDAEEEGVGTQPPTTQVDDDEASSPDLGPVGDGDGTGEEEEDADGPVVTDLVDADNGFNRLSRFAMLWTVRHRWASMARFTHNNHRHFVRLVLRVPGKAPHILLSKEG